MRFPIARRIGTGPHRVTARPKEQSAIAPVEDPGASGDQKPHDSKSDLLAAGPHPDAPRVRSRQAVDAVLEQVQQAVTRDPDDMIRAITHFRPQAWNALQT